MPIPFFRKNLPFLDQFSSDRMNELARAASNGVVSVSGNVKMVRQGDGVALHVPPPPDKPGVAFAVGSSTSLSSGSTDVSLASITNENDQNKMIELSGSTLTFKTVGWYLVSYTANIVYTSSDGADCALMKEAKVSMMVKVGGTDVTESKGYATLSSRANLSNYVKITPNEESLDNIVFYHGEHVSETAVEDSDEPESWHGSATENGNWVVWTTEVNPGSDLLVEAAPILSNLEVKEAYNSILFDAQTAPGQCLIQVISTSDGLKIKWNGTNYSPTLSLAGTVTFGGEGTVNPTITCESATLSFLRIT